MTKYALKFRKIPREKVSFSLCKLHNPIIVFIEVNYYCSIEILKRV